MGYKICLILENYNVRGGLERVVSLIANGLANCGHNVFIISIGKGVLPAYDTDERIKLHELNFTNTYKKTSRIRFIGWIRILLRDIKKTIRIRHLLKSIHPDFVVAEGIELFRHVNFVKWTIPFKAIGCEHRWLEANQSFTVKLGQKLAIKNASKLVVLSKEDLATYQKKYPNASNLKQIYNPIAFNTKSNYQPNSKIVIAAGRYVPQKGFDLLIESWSRIADKIPDWELRIFGDGELRNELQAQIDHYNLSNVKLCGFTKELDRELEKASIFALSSRFEGWGLVLIEAQAKGLPCISFNCKCGPSEIIDDGVNGLLVSPENTEEFAEKLLLLMQNEELRRSFSANAQKDLYRFDSEKVVGEWIALFDSLSKE